MIDNTSLSEIIALLQRIADALESIAESNAALAFTLEDDDEPEEPRESWQR